MRNRNELIRVSVDMIRISVLEPVTSQIVDLDANPSATVGEITNIVANQLGLPKRNYTLDIHGRRLSSHVTLAQAGIVDKDELTLAQPAVTEWGLKRPSLKLFSSRKALFALSMLIIVVLSLASVYFVSQLPGSPSTTSNGQPFDFSVIASHTDGTPVTTIVLCGAGYSELAISILPISGNPRSVNLVVRDVESHPLFIDGISLSQTSGIPPFTSTLLIRANYNYAHEGDTYVLTLVGDDLVGQLHTLSITVVYQCRAL